VKFLPHRAADASDRGANRLRAEARAGYRVNHANVVRVLDCDTLQGYWYFVMEYVPGADLAHLIEQHARPPWPQVVAIARDALAGLAAIHDAGLVHRDIKPANLLLGADGRLRIADLGVAGLIDDEDAALGVQLYGTLGYAAPETLTVAGRADARADLYSLGATLFELLTGRLPHQRGGMLRQLLDSQARTPIWPDADAATPEWLRTLILRLLAPEPGDRPASALETLALLHSGDAPAAPVSAAVRPEVLQPRGLVVLPFGDRTPAASEQWLGFALADGLARALSQLPGVYLADQAKFSQIHAQLVSANEREEQQRLLEAGRLVGAATIIVGRLERRADAIHIAATIHRLGETPLLLDPLGGPLAQLAALQAQLFERVAAALGLAGPTAAVAADTTLAAREQFILGKQAYLRGDYAAAIRCAEEAARLDPEFVEPLQYIGACYARLGQYAQAAAHHHRQEQIALDRRDSRLLVEAQANLGVMHYFQGNFDEAHRVFSAAAAAAEQLGLTTELAQIYNNLGFALIRLHRPQEAQAAFGRAIETHRAFGALASLIGPYNGMGSLLLDQQRYPEAEQYYGRALALAHEIGDRTNVGVAHMHLGRCAAARGQADVAKTEFALALNALEETSFWNGLAKAYEYVADLHLQSGDYEEAARCADKRIDLARRQNNRPAETAAWRQLADIWRQAGRIADAERCLSRARECSLN
jgi:tetratricopeptide (TPR) repeat protein